MIESYTLNINTSPSHIIFHPNMSISNDSQMKPSPKLNSNIQNAMLTRNPNLIGKVTESFAINILNGSRLEIEGVDHSVKCIRWKDFKISIRPSYGILCDDLVTIAYTGNDVKLFFTECKGTVTKRGLSHDIEAKAIYQLMRTHKAAMEQIDDYEGYSIGGTISFMADHFRKHIVINIIDSTRVINGGYPDHWMYSSKR